MTLPEAYSLMHQNHMQIVTVQNYERRTGWTHKLRKES